MRTMSDELSSYPSSQPAIPLSYEPPQPKPPKGGVSVVIILVTLFVCGASVGLFAIEAEAIRQAMYSAPNARPDSWPAAVAVIALAAMGTSFGFFLTRRR
jgi:hypothetical protein